MQSRKKPLYRKVNTTARGVRHKFGGDHRDERAEVTPTGMKKGVRRGLDYTPLYRFLLSRVGSPWSEVQSEAVSRLDEESPLYDLVSLEKKNAREYVRVGESSYFSGLFVDKDGILRILNPDIDETSLKPFCKCCTHTFNGKVFTQRYGN